MSRYTPTRLTWNSRVKGVFRRQHKFFAKGRRDWSNPGLQSYASRDRATPTMGRRSSSETQRPRSRRNRATHAGAGVARPDPGSGGPSDIARLPLNADAARQQLWGSGSRWHRTFLGRGGRDSLGTRAQRIQPSSHVPGEGQTRLSRNPGTASPSDTVRPSLEPS